MTSRAEREHHVAQMLANHRIEGYEPDEADKQLQAAYIDGTATLDDLLTHARQYAAARGDAGNIIFSPEFREGVQDAVAEAVARSKAL
jgi:hypothetical protein